MILKAKLKKQEMKLLVSMNAIFPAHENYAYYSIPWTKVEMGSNKVEFYVNEKDYPEDLKKILENDINKK